MSACDHCLARAWLLAALAGRLDVVRARADELLALGDAELIEAVGAGAGGSRADGGQAPPPFDAAAARDAVAAAGLEAICRCQAAYPVRLQALAAPPAVLFVAGGLKRALELLAEDPVALVGARRASAYGHDVARSLGRGVSAAGVTVISGMALGIDSAAHDGALAAGRTIAVLPGPADRPYPVAKRALHRRIVAGGAAISELPPGAEIRRWMFPARNRIIAALAAITVVVEAGHRSGALLTAACAKRLGRPVGAVPGRVTSPQSTGPNALLTRGALVIRDPQDVLDALYGAGARHAAADARTSLDGEQRSLLGALGSGDDTVEALLRAGFEPDRLLASLAALELEGHIRRHPGGRFAVMP
jgi:DNA processing protein